MFKNTQTYITIASAMPSKPAVLKSKEVPAEFKGKRFIAAAVMAVSLGVMTLQAGYVLNANASENPISAPVSTQESPSPSASPSSAPISAPEITPSPSSQPSHNGGGNDGGNNNSGSSHNHGGSSSAPSCNNEAPKAPHIVSALTSGKNEITLNWTKPEGNVTHYSVAYGVAKNKPLYGAANVGNVTSFKVKGLSGGGTYFFSVKAVNDCTPSAASNEVGVKVGGQFISTPAHGFKQGVLGQNTKVVNQTGKPALAKPVIFNTNTDNKPVNSGLVGKVFNFFKGWF